MGRLRALPQPRLTGHLSEPGASERILDAKGEASLPSLARQPVSERLSRWLGRGLVVDLGCGSNPLRDLAESPDKHREKRSVSLGVVRSVGASGVSTGSAQVLAASGRPGAGRSP